MPRHYHNDVLQQSFLEKWGAVLAIFVLYFVIITAIVLAGVIHTPTERACAVAEIICNDAGWQGYELQGDALYCTTFGTEPRIERIGTVYELAKKWRR